MKKAIYQFGLWSLLLLVVVACDETEEMGDPIPSFQAEQDATEFLKVQFTNFSENYVSSSWDFGDGTGTSTEESPLYTYATAGTYDVTLTVTNDAGLAVSKTEPVEVADPEAKLTLVSGIESKTWKLLREGTSMLLASDPQFSDIYWPGNKNDGTRPCIYDDTFTFTRGGDYVYDDGGTFWGEDGVFAEEGCFEATVANMVNKDGANVSEFLSGTHKYEFDAENDEITLTGLGAWMGIVGLGTTEKTAVPQESVTFSAVPVNGGDSGVDTLYVSFPYDGLFWAITYVSYEDPSVEPALVTEFVPVECTPLDAVSPAEISHTFASNDPAEWTLLQFDATSGSGLELGVDDPSDGTATKVGKYTRNAGVDFQELIFQLEPKNSINFVNLTTVTVDVYLPSSNDYSGALTDNVFIGFGNRECPPFWYEDQHEYQQTEVAKDEWVTVTFNLDTPTFVNKPANGATVYDRNDLDMLYIAIGGGGHKVGAEFYMRNFIIN